MPVRSIRNIKDVIEHIKGLESLSELDVEYYAVENGAADIVAQNVKREMKVNQLRRFFDEIKRIQIEYRGKDLDESFDPKKLYKILPELAFALGRKLITHDYYRLMKECIRNDDGKTRIKTVRDFDCFVNFLSAILAYHKLRAGS